jgi:hypothetical protein
MEVDAINWNWEGGKDGKGKGKGKGKDNKGKGKGKDGKGKGKDNKGKGKGKGAIGPCHVCGKMGHLKEKCWWANKVNEVEAQQQPQNTTTATSTGSNAKSLKCIQVEEERAWVFTWMQRPRGQRLRRPQALRR